MRSPLVFALVFLASCSASQVKIHEQKPSVLLPVTWGFSPEKSAATVVSGENDDPLMFGMRVVTALTSPAVRSNRGSVTGMEAAFAKVMAARNELGYWPHPAYSNFPEGWYSGMDFAGVALAAAALADVTGIRKYRRAGEALILDMIRPADEGGTLWSSDKTECWMAEYLWPGMDEAQQNYVLNGFLLALQALVIFERSMDDRRVSEALECSIESLKAVAGDFFFADGSWSFYMLDGPSTNPAHYLIYETNQFDALYALTGDGFFADQASKRRAIFATHYPVYQDGNDYLFLRTGTPHPYLPDIYQTRLIFMDIWGAEVGRSESGGDNRMVMRGSLPRRASAVSVVVYSGRSEIEMSRGPLVATPGGAAVKIGFTGSAWIDADAVHGGWLVGSDGRISLALDGPCPASAFDRFALDVTLSAGTRWGIGIWGEDGSEIYRYLPEMKRGRHVVPLSRYGFSKPHEVPESIIKVVLYFYPAEPLTVSINKLTTLPDQAAFAGFVEDTKPGRLYIEN